MTSYGDYFTRQFNKQLGKPMGRPIASPEYVAPRYNPGQIEREVANSVSQGVVNLGTDVENAYEDMYGKSSIGGGTLGGGFLAKSIQNQLNKTTKEATRNVKEQQKVLNKEIAEQDRLDYASQLAAAKASEAEHENSNPIMRTMGGILGKGLEYLGRPQQALLTGINELVNQPGGGKEPGWSDFTPWDAPGGFWSGLTGKKHTSGGELMEELFPSAPHILKIAGGATIDLGADPLNWVGLGAIKELSGVKRGAKIANESRMVDSAQQAVRDAFKKSTLTAGKGARRMPGTGLFTNSTEAAIKNLDDEVAAHIKDAILDIHGGSLRGGRLSAGHKAQLADSTATRGVERMRKFRYEKFDNYVEQYKAHIASRNAGTGDLLTPAQIKTMKKDDFFREFMDQLPTGKMTPSKWDAAIKKADEAVRTNLDKDLEDFSGHINRNIAKSYRTGVGVRVGGKWIRLPYIGKAMELASNVIPDSVKSLSHSGQFPGKLALLQQRGRSIGVKKLEEFRNEVEEWATHYDKTQRAEIVRAIEGGNPRAFAHDPHMQQGMDFVKDHMKRMWDEEVAAGARDPNVTKYLDNYTYVWNRKGPKKALEDFKRLRKEQISGTKRSAANFNTQAAANQGLKPVTDAGDMLLHRQMKSNRDMTRALFRNDLVEQYGTVARGLSEHGRTSRGLTEISRSGLSDHVRSFANEALGDKHYLGKEHHNVLRDFDELSKFTTDPRLVRLFRKFTNVFKSSATVYNPGYHTRNMISDTIMGVLDGVGVKPYYDLLRKKNWSLYRSPGEKIARFHPKAGATVKIAPGWSMSMHELWNLFKENAAGGGFISADIGRSTLGRSAAKVNEGVRRVSEVREDFGRVAHFLGALRQEAKGGLRTGLRGGGDAAKEKAVQQAVYRVNHFKFDYGALTKWEQRYVKPVVPFYTFARKAFPTMMENFAMNPKWINRYRKLRESRDGDEAKNFMSYTMPPWLKDVGFATIADEKEPWVAGFESLPTNVLQSVIPQEKSVAGLAKNIMSQVNPAFQMLPELAYRKEIFSGKKIDSYPEYLMGKFGGPLQSGIKTHESLGRGQSLWQTALTSRLGAGLPLHKISTEQQDFQRKVWEDENIDTPFDEFSEGPGKEVGISVYTSKGADGMTSYKVRDTKTGKVIYQDIDPFKTLAFAKTQRGTPSLPVALDTWNESTGKKANLSVYWSERKDGSSYRVRNTKTNDVLGDFKDVTRAYALANRRAQASVPNQFSAENIFAGLGNS